MHGEQRVAARHLNGQYLISARGDAHRREPAAGIRQLDDAHGLFARFVKAASLRAAGPRIVGRAAFFKAAFLMDMPKGDIGERGCSQCIPVKRNMLCITAMEHEDPGTSGRRKRDVVGLCKAAAIGKVYDDNGKFVGYEDDSIGDQDFSLNPGRYVGVVIEDDGLTQEEFKERMMAYYTALSKLNEEAHGLEKKISGDLISLFKVEMDGGTDE